MGWAWFYLTTCVIIWGWTFVFTKVGLQYVSPVELLGLRFAVGVPTLLVIAFFKRLRFDFGPKEKRSVMLGSAVITVHFLIQVIGLKHTSATNTGWIIAVTPLVMAAMAFVLLRERLSRRALVGIGVATVGISLLMSKGQFGNLGWLSSVGDWLILASAHTWALYTVVVRDVTRARDPIAVTFAVLLPSAGVFLGYMAFTSHWADFLQIPLDGVLAILFLGLLGLALAHWFWQEGVARLGAAKAGIFLYLEPLATTALAVPYLGEEFGVFTAWGGLLVLAGVYLAQRKS